MKEEQTEDINEQNVPNTSSVMDASTEETETKDEIKGSLSSVQKPPSIFQILGLATLAAGLVVSVLLNVSLLSIGGDNDSNISSFQWFVVGGTLLITAVSLGISFWLYYIRSLYLKDGPALVPEKWGVLLADLTHVTNQTNINTVENLSSLIRESSHLSRKSEALLESFLTLQETISNRDEEIARLKKGYDSKIFKRFITRFIRVSIALHEVRREASDSDQAKNYKYLCRLIQSALEECGVEQLSPEIGVDYRQLGSEVDDDPKIIDTNDGSRNFLVASVESPSYMIEGEGDREIILPAKVTIYAYQEEGTSENV
jgi:hypothetical protein